MPLWIWCLALSSVLRDVTGTLTVKPRSVTVVRGQTVVFRCGTNLSVPVSWSHKTMKYIIPDTLYVDGELFTENDNYMVNASAAEGRHDLIIKSVQPSDAGRYICRDNNGFAGEDVGVAELTVLLNSTMSCSENSTVLHNATAGPEASQLEMISVECAVNYTGSGVPSFEWFDKEHPPVNATAVIVDSEAGDEVYRTATYRIVTVTKARHHARPYRCGVSGDKAESGDDSDTIIVICSNMPPLAFSTSQQPSIDYFMLVTCVLIVALLLSGIVVAIVLHKSGFGRRSCRCNRSTKNTRVVRTAATSVLVGQMREDVRDELHFTWVTLSEEKRDPEPVYEHLKARAVIAHTRHQPESSASSAS